MKPNLFVLGCGGVGSWLTPALSLLTSKEQITLIDGDTLEGKNLDRQLFSDTDIGSNKADALGAKYGCQSMPEWFCEGLLRLEEQDWLMVCVDNHAARRSALAECDRHGCRAILAANETHSAEAVLYNPMWKGSIIDPRVVTPAILTDRTGDPRRASIGCTGEAQAANRQLVSSNSLSAALAGHLFALWHLKAPKLSKNTVKTLPYKFVGNMTKFETFKVSDINQ